MRKNIKTDETLVKEYVAGNALALEELIRRHKSKVFTSIAIFTKDKYLAEDLFQDTFIKVIDKLKAGKYTEEGKFKPWVMRIAYNICVDNYRKTKRTPRSISAEDFDIFDILPMQESPEDMLIENQSKTKVRKLLDELPADQREVVLLRHYYDFSFKEIAELCDISINTALGRMRYALINLRKVVTDKQIQL
jgi:RNA polymerase sigma factor (sigma-70 family)